MPMKRALLAANLMAMVATIVGLPSIFTGRSGLGAGVIADLPATEAVRLLCDRQITAVQYAEALLNRVERHHCINAFATVDTKKVLTDAKAVDDAYNAGKSIEPLCGLPFAVKDNIDVLGYPTEAATLALQGREPCNSSALVTRLLDANGIVLGKTRMHELAMGTTTVNVYGGPVLNPYNNTMHAGGSSGGTAAAVAMRLAPAGFCSDTGGSCRIPASVTGVVGFRPTSGCWDAADGIVPMSVTRDTVGLNARTVADVKLFNDIFSDCDRSYKAVEPDGLRVGYPTNFWKDIGHETKPAFDAALEAMQAAGVQLVPLDMSVLVDFSHKHTPDMLFLTYEMPRELARYLYQHTYNITLVEMVDKISNPPVKAFMTEWMNKKLDSFPTPADYAKALSIYIPHMKDMWTTFHDSYDVDVLVVPTTPITSRPIDDVEPYVTVNGRKMDSLEVYTRFTMVDCPLGVPGLSIPIGLAADGMPIGIMLQGRPGRDADVLSVGDALQPLFAATPKPSEEQPCTGCTPHVKVVDVTWDGRGQPSETDSTSVYELELQGSCKLMAAS